MEASRETISTNKRYVSIVSHIWGYKWRYLGVLLFMVMFLPNLFTLWVVDYRAIDVKWARNISQSIIDPAIDDLLGDKGLSHNEESK